MPLCTTPLIALRRYCQVMGDAKEQRWKQALKNGINEENRLALILCLLNRQAVLKCKMIKEDLLRLVIERM